MKLLKLSLLLVLAGCKYNGLEDGYYVVSTDRKLDFFCTEVSVGDQGLLGKNCVDMTCEFMGDRRARANVLLRGAVYYETRDFNYKLVPCGPKENK